MSRWWFRRSSSSEAPAAVRGLTLIGYWRSSREPHWPAPFDFVDDDWDREERELVATYLDAAPATPWTYLGYSWCRICLPEPQRDARRLEDREEIEIVVNGTVLKGYKSLPGEQNGSGERSDGTYLWPEGLSHYVREHSVRLPQSVVQHIRSCGGSPLPDRGASISQDDVDEQWWKVACPDW